MPGRRIPGKENAFGGLVTYEEASQQLNHFFRVFLFGIKMGDLIR